MERVGALQNWGSGMGRRSGNAKGRGMAETRGGWCVVCDGVALCACHPPPQGCVEKIGGWLRSNVLVVAGAALGIAFVEVRGVLGTYSRSFGEERQ